MDSLSIELSVSSVGIIIIIIIIIIVVVVVAVIIIIIVFEEAWLWPKCYEALSSSLEPLHHFKGDWEGCGMSSA